MVFGIALCLGLGFASLSMFWLAPFHLAGYPFTGGDFNQYCESIEALRIDQMGMWSHHRSIVAGWIPAQLATQFGIIDGLLLGAFVSQVLTGGAIFLWARAIYSTFAGVMAVLLACTCAPLVVLSRTVTFYPETVALYLFCVSTAVWALNRRSLGSIALTGLAIGTCLLVDVRGLLWALPAFFLAGFAVLLSRNWRYRIMGAVLLWTPIYYSFQFGAQVYAPTTPSLERHAEYYVDDALRQTGFPSMEPGNKPDIGFVWGRDPLSTIPTSLQKLHALQQNIPDSVREFRHTKRSVRQHVLPWVFPVAFGLCVLIWGMRKHLILCFGFLVSILPGLMSIHGTSTLVFNARYLSNGMAVFPVILGTAFAVLVQEASQKISSKQNGKWTRLLPWVAGLGTAILVFGLLPSGLGPNAEWRTRLQADQMPIKSIYAALHPDETPRDVSEFCRTGFQTDIENGLLPGSDLLNWTLDPGGNESHYPKQKK